MGRLVRTLALSESIKRIKEEIIRFLEIRFDECYEGNDDNGIFKGENFDYHWTCGELMGCYIPSEGLTMDEICEAVEYINHYGYHKPNGEPYYNGILGDWNGITIAMDNVKKKKLYDEDGTFKANNGLADYPIKSSNSSCLELLQVITEHMIPMRGEDEDYDAFYARCRRITDAYITKYNTTDFTIIGENMWSVAEHYCDVIKDVKEISTNGRSIVVYEYYV